MRWQFSTKCFSHKSEIENIFGSPQEDNLSFCQVGEMLIPSLNYGLQLSQPTTKTNIFLYSWYDDREVFWVSVLFYTRYHKILNSHRYKHWHTANHLDRFHKNTADLLWVIILYFLLLIMCSQNYIFVFFMFIMLPCL